MNVKLFQPVTRPVYAAIVRFAKAVLTGPQPQRSTQQPGLFRSGRGEEFIVKQERAVAVRR